MAWEHFYFDQIKIGGGDIFTNFSDRYYANGRYGTWIPPGHDRARMNNLLKSNLCPLTSICYHVKLSLDPYSLWSNLWSNYFVHMFVGTYVSVGLSTVAEWSTWCPHEPKVWGSTPLALPIAWCANLVWDSKIHHNSWPSSGIMERRCVPLCTGMNSVMARRNEWL